MKPKPNRSYLYVCGQSKKEGKVCIGPKLKVRTYEKFKILGPKPWIVYAKSNLVNQPYQMWGIRVTFSVKWSGAQWLQIPHEKVLWYWNVYDNV